MVSAILAALLATTQASAGPATAAPEAKPVKEKKICKVDPAETGSRMKKRLCLTASEWDQKNNKGKDVSTLRSDTGR